MGQNVVAIFDLVLIPTNTLPGFHVVSTWNPRGVFVVY